ncbi:MAG: hypothetical protein AAF541_12465 [Pseudomonadota bacterium]
MGKGFIARAESVWRCLSVLVLAMLGSATVFAAERIDNFRLFDHTGDSHHLYYFSDMQAVVVFVQDASCSTDVKALEALKTTSSKYAEDVSYFGLNATGASRTQVQQAMSAAEIEIPVLMDGAQLVSQNLQVRRAGEALLIDPETWQVLYRGNPGKGLQAALAEVTQNEPVTTATTEVEGCELQFVEVDGSKISYPDTIAPILAENCVSCHRPGGIGPWAMTDHNMVRGFSLMIREVLMTQRMPPWHADPEVGHFNNDRALTRNELQTIVSWIDAGAPRGEGEDPLMAFNSALPAWGDLGEPDLIIDIPSTDVPATGVVEYQYKYVTNPLNRDVWVRASQILPGDRAVLHHVITRFGELETSGPRQGRLKRRGGGGLGGYVPGRVARALPDGTGTFLPAGATIEFQMHYTTSGRASTDHSKIGIYFHEAKPDHAIRSMILANGGIRIPPHAKAHAESAVREFDKDALMYNLLPHAHYRGKASRFVAQYPDGSEEVLLNVPNYDFNWQTTYELAEPKFIPAGTKVVYTNWWDNSAQNPANPDPTREVRWGRQSWDEMIFGAITYREISSEEALEVAGSD